VTLLHKMNDFMADETGDGLLVLFPVLALLGMMMFALMMNFMIWNTEKNGIQIMADSASRAGTVAISKSYAIRERTGHGLEDYHVYTELNEAEAENLSEQVIEGYKKHIKLAEVTQVDYNPVENFTFPVWNSNTFRYDNRPLSTKKQLKNGNFSVYVKGRVKSIWPRLLGVKDELEVEIYSQSAARGTVTSVH